MQSTNVNSRYFILLDLSADYFLLLKTLFFTWLLGHLILIVFLLFHWPFSVCVAGSYSTLGLNTGEPRTTLSTVCTNSLGDVIQPNDLTYYVYVEDCQITPKFMFLAGPFPLSKLNLYIQLTSTWMSNRYVKKCPKLISQSPHVPFPHKTCSSGNLPYVHK